MKSAIYTGLLRHRRYRPRAHNFSYRVFMMYLDLAEIDQVLAKSRWWSKSRWALARFRREDFLDPHIDSLDSAVRKRIFEREGVEHTGPIRLLANLRYFGYNMNPIATYYCFDQDEQLRFIVAEVNNTPWDQRQCYVLRCDPEQKRQRIIFNKAMHVSPFNPMDMQYQWCSNQPDKRLAVHINTWRDGEKQLDATLSLEREAISSESLHRIIWRYPLMTMKVVVAIYWQALRLWLKRVPFYGAPEPVEKDGKAESL